MHQAIRDDAPYVERDTWSVTPKKPSSAGCRFERRVLDRRPVDFRNRPVPQPIDGKAFGRALAARTRFAKVLVWLDDLERYVGSGDLSDANLNTLCRTGSVSVMATIREQRVRQAAAGRQAARGCAGVVR